MVEYEESGNLVTDKREIAASETWESQSDWEAYQSIDNVDIENGIISLSSFQTSVTPDSAIYHFDATNLNLNDGDSVDVMPDETQTLGDAEGSGGVYHSDAINGQPAVKGNGEAEYVPPTLLEGQAKAFIVVFVHDNNPDAREQIIGSTWGPRFYLMQPSYGSETHQLGYGDDYLEHEDWAFTEPEVYAMWYDDGTAYGELNQDESNRGSFSSSWYAGTNVHFFNHEEEDGYEGWIGEVIIYNEPIGENGTLQDEYDRLESKWGEF